MSLPSDFSTRYGPWAVVTGASSGIGAEFARQLAGAGLSVVLVARRVERMKELSKEICENYPVETLIIPADLATDEGCQAVVAGTQDVDVGLVINNAGVEGAGSFFHHTMERHARLLSVNVNATTAISHALGRRLAERGRGGMIFVSSLLSTPCPYFSVYSASKAYVTTLSVILREELAPKGVDVLCLEPGVVQSEMSARALADVDLTKKGFKMQAPKDCVSETLESLYKKQVKVTPGLMNKVSMFFVHLMPDWMRMKVMGTVIDSAMKPELKEYA